MLSQHARSKWMEEVEILKPRPSDYQTTKVCKIVYKLSANRDTMLIDCSEVEAMTSIKDRLAVSRYKVHKRDSNIREYNGRLLSNIMS